jgi:hypothetical protein
VKTVSTQSQGIKISRTGYDVNTCPDWALLFNSSWPSLAVAFQKDLTQSSNITTIEHNLGFPPLTMAWIVVDGVEYGRLPGNYLEVTDKDIFFFGGLTAVPSYNIRIRCYNIDISKQVSYPLPISSAVKLPYDDTFGIKVSQDNKSINSRDLRDFVLHSKAQSPAVLDIVSNSGTTSGTLSYKLKTQYIPWILATESTNNAYSFLTINAVSYNNGVLSASSAAGNVTLIILRDPLFYPNVVRVVYSG